ncbi:MAG: holo-[acyl-carrier protein] synthase [Candidatus Paceibacteria bacterium]|jgi:holo-[acyl-carrier protein] synthase
MSIQSIGSDLTRIDRLREAHERRGQALLDRLFTPGEQTYCDSRKARFTHYAGRFAAKEAVMKVLGSGWGKGVQWVDIEVTREQDMPPAIELHGEAANIACEIGITRIHISLSHDAGMALAFAIGEREG